MSGHGKHYVDINIGRFVGATAQAFRQLADDDQVKFGSFEARFLRCRLVHLFAIWLKSDIEGGDLIYPLQGGAPSPMQAGQLYPQADFEGSMLMILQELQNNT